MKNEWKKLKFDEFLSRHEEFGFSKAIQKYPDGSSVVTYEADDSSPVVLSIIADSRFNEEIGTKQVINSYGDYTEQDETIYLTAVNGTCLTLSIEVGFPEAYLTGSFEYRYTTTGGSGESYVEISMSDSVKDWTMEEFIEQYIEPAVMQDIRNNI